MRPNSRALFLGALLAGLGTCSVIGHSIGKVSFSNTSSETIRALHVTVSTTELQAAQIAAGGGVSFQYEIGQNSDYVI